MRKISLGSFPLIDVVGKDRRIFESYLIKVISDLITANQLSNSIYTDRVQYVTPLSILKFIKEDQKGLVQTTPQPNKDVSSDDRSRKAKSIQNAFRNTKALYQSIANDPFYRNNMFYPIYIEETIKTNYGYSDYNYDFLILANDLIKQQIVDEIRFDDKATLLFLVLKCLLVPNMKISDIGTSKNKGGDFRKYFALFLETCKNENQNPFDMFIKLIKVAGKQKRNNVPGALAKISGRLLGNQSKDDTGLYHSKSFVNLFNTAGEIKDVSFLLNESLSKINKFLSDDNKGIDPDYNPILRQYSQAKTHEYGKILSVIDALGAFNRTDNVLTELNSNSMLSNIKVNAQESLTINKDVIINELETIYFRRFLEDLKKLESNAIIKVRNQLIKEFGQDILNSNIETKEKLVVSKAKIEKNIQTVARDLKTVKDEAIRFANTIGLLNFEEIPDKRPDLINTPSYYNRVQDITTNENRFNDLNSDLNIITNKLNKAPSQNTVEEAINDKQLSLQVNLEIFQAQLTALYSEIYQYVYSKAFDDHIVALSTKGPINISLILTDILNSSNSGDLNSAKITIGEIVSGFENELEINIRREVLQEFKDQKALKMDFKKIIDTEINIDDINNIIAKNIFVPIFVKYTNKSISETNRIKDLKATNNPILKRILSNKELFKSYLLNSEVLVAAYELLHYIDTLKYEEGIINHPVSRVSSDINKIDFMIKRLGLDDNPVFIFKDNNILLSMPGHLSLTGSHFLNQVKMQEFVQFGSINWSRDLWDHNQMFGGPENSSKYKEIKKDIDKIKKEIEDASAEIKNADAKQKIKLQAKINAAQLRMDKKQEEQRKLLEIQRNNNFTSNMNVQKRPENPSTYEMQYRPGGRYNTNMDQQGYYPHERDIINQSRDGMDHLRQQTVQPYPTQQQPYPNNQQYVNDQFGMERQQNNFMNNPYIQNRINQISPSRNNFEDNNPQNDQYGQNIIRNY